MMKNALLSICFLCLIHTAFGQTLSPYENDIRNFEKQDAINPPKKAQILFVGSSSFRLWTDLEMRLSEYNIIKRAFGGGELNDVHHFSDRIIIPYHPVKIFLYAGENDIAAGKSVEETYQIFLRLFNDISVKLPNSKVYFLSVKPSPKRKVHGKKFNDFNLKVKTYLNSVPCNWTYIDVTSAILGKDGLPLPELFIEDQIHLNSAGYDIWEKIIKNYL
jgi:hypothetical protein